MLQILANSFVGQQCFIMAQPDISQREDNIQARSEMSSTDHSDTSKELSVCQQDCILGVTESV